MSEQHEVDCTQEGRSRTQKSGIIGPAQSCSAAGTVPHRPDFHRERPPRKAQIARMLARAHL